MASDNEGAGIGAPAELPKAHALDAEMARAEIKEWTTRCLLVLPLQFGTAALLVERLDGTRTKPVAAFWLALVLGLALVVLARLSQYCTDAIATGESYLRTYHREFWDKYKVYEFGEGGSFASYHLSSSAALAVGATYHVWNEEPRCYCVVGGFMACALVWGVLAYARWRRPKSTWPEPWTNLGKYHDTSIKCLRDEILAWQTRRFALLTAVFAIVGLELKAWQQVWLDPISLAILMILVVRLAFQITARAGERNERASEILRNMDFHWEVRIEQHNVPRKYLPSLTLNVIALICYCGFGLAALAVAIWHVLGPAFMRALGA